MTTKYEMFLKYLYITGLSIYRTFIQHVPYLNIQLI